MTSPLLPPEAAADPIRLPAHATTVTAAALRDRLVQAADAAGATDIDAADVESVGQAVLQLLVAARRDAQATGRPFAIHNPSAAFVGRVAACRLDEAIGLAFEKEDLQ